MDIRAQRLLPLVDLLVLQLLVAVGTLIAPLWDFPGWQGSAAGLAVALILVIPVRGMTLPRLIALRVGFGDNAANEPERRRSPTPSTYPWQTAHSSVSVGMEAL